MSELLALLLLQDLSRSCFLPGKARNTLRLDGSASDTFLSDSTVKSGGDQVGDIQVLCRRRHGLERIWRKRLGRSGFQEPCMSRIAGCGKNWYR